jgi:capsular polysaccharide biosynthesis protein
MQFMLTGPGQSANVDPSSNENLLSLGTVLHVLWTRLWVIVLIATLFTGAAVGHSLMQPPQYEASIKLLVGEKDRIVEAPAETLNFQSLTSTMVEAIMSRSIAQSAVRELDSQLSPDVLFGGMSAEAVEGTQFIWVHYTDNKPKRAQRVANAIGAAFSKQIEEAGSGESPVTITVWQRAQLPGAPVSPDPVNAGLLAFLMGSVIGVGAAFLLEFLDHSWRSPEEAESISGIPTLGIVPRFKRPNSKKMNKQQKIQYG